MKKSLVLIAAASVCLISCSATNTSASGSAELKNLRFPQYWNFSLKPHGRDEQIEPSNGKFLFTQNGDDLNGEIDYTFFDNHHETKTFKATSHGDHFAAELTHPKGSGGFFRLKGDFGKPSLIRGEVLNGFTKVATFSMSAEAKPSAEKDFPYEWVLQPERESGLKGAYVLINKEGENFKGIAASPVSEKTSREEKYFRGGAEGTIKNSVLSMQFEDPKNKVCSFTGTWDPFKGVFSGEYIDGKSQKGKAQLTPNNASDNGRYAAAPTTEWNLECKPPLLDEKVEIAPSVELQRSNEHVKGTATYYVSNCGNEVPQRVDITGKWTAKDVELDVALKEPTHLKGSLDAASGKITGSATGGRKFVLTPKKVDAQGEGN